MAKPKRRNMPPNRRLIESKFVFKKKKDSQIRAHLISQGYTQIPGVDLTKSYSPVVTDVTLHAIPRGKQYVFFKVSSNSLL